MCTPLGKTISFNIKNDTTVEDLKEMLKDREGFPTNIQMILHAGKPLNDSIILTDVGVQQLSTLRVHFKKLAMPVD